MFANRYVKLSLAAILLATPMLSACSSGQFNMGDKKTAQIADISTLGNPTAAEALNDARGHFSNRNYGHSAAYYKRYVELVPDDPEGYVGLAASYDRLGRFDLSDRVYSSLHRVGGGTLQYYNNLGYSQMLRGDMGAALNSFKKARGIDPDNIVVNNNIQMLSDATMAA